MPSRDQQKAGYGEDRIERVFLVLASLTAVLTTIVSFSGRFILVDEKLSPLVAGVVTAAAAAVSAVYLARRYAARRGAKRVFIAYSYSEKELALQVAAIIEDSGYEAWLESEKILPGQVREYEIFRAIRECSVAIVIISKDLETENSKRADIDLIYKTSSISILPIRFDETPFPQRMSDIQWLDLREERWAEKLLRSLDYLTQSGNRKPQEMAFSRGADE